MTAPVIQIARARGRGRQPAAVEAVREARDELRVVAEEALDFAVVAVHLARRIQVSLASGRLGLIGDFADELERIGNHATVRAKAAAVIARVRQAEANNACPDEYSLVAEPGHGVAA